MLNYNQIKERAYIIHDGEPWEVIASQVSRKQANKPVNKTKLKNLVNGRVIEHTFHVSDKANEAEVSRREVQFLYYQEKQDEYWFADPSNPKDRFVLPETVIPDTMRFVREKDTVQALVFTDKEGEDMIIGLKIPIKVELTVAEAPPNIKGDTATGGNKVVTLETGATVNAPLFINAGDVIAVKTETGEYTERVSKA